MGSIPGITIVGLVVLVVRIQLNDATVTESRIAAESLKSFADFSKSTREISSRRSPKGGAGIVVESFATEGLLKPAGGLQPPRLEPFPLAGAKLIINDI